MYGIYGFICHFYLLVVKNLFGCMARKFSAGNSIQSEYKTKSYALNIKGIHKI